MKKDICLFLVALGLVLCLCGCQNVSTQNGDENSTPIENSVEKSEVEESLAEKFIREIDDNYRKESKLPEYSTTIGMVELAGMYTEKWKQVADEYYNKIMEFDGIIQLNEYYSPDDFHTFVSNMKTNWEQYNQIQCENYGKTLLAIYEGGTIAGPIFAGYKYEMQKEWALQIVGIYEQLYIE